MTPSSQLAGHTNLSGPACFGALMLAVVAGTGPAFAAQADATRLFEKYCFECHGDGAKKGKFALDELLKAGPSASQASWEKAWKIVRHEFMPPAGADTPSPAERKAITQWIESQKLGVDHQNPDPGRVTIRRLNRMEYDYTITDLFGVNLTAAQEFSSDLAANDARLRDKLPPDDTAFGFDNNGDFLSLSPALLEKFFNIAEWVVDRVIVQDGPRHPVINLTELGFQSVKADDTKKVEQSVPFEARHDGTYRVDLRFIAGQFAEIQGTFEILILVDGREVLRDELEIGGHRTHKYSKEFALTQGRHTWTFSTRPLKPDAKGRLNSLEPRIRAQLTGPIGTGVYEYPESHRRVFFNGDAPGDPDARRNYARAIVQRVADRAFRRPTEPEVLDRLTQIVMRNDNFTRGVGQALTAILTSPKFLFRAELQARPDDPKSIHPIDEFALASRLSSLLWLSIPDDELTSLAAAGRLRANLAAQLRRMLADEKSGRFFEDFPGQWLRTRNVLMTAISKDGELNPVRAAMKRETEMLFEDIARNDRDLIQLITADYTFVDKALAEYYGLKDFEGDGFQRIALAPETHRGGLLTHGSFLVATSNPNRTSPVKRGLYVLDSLWGTQVPAPPADIPALDEAQVGGATPKTVREQLTVHRENKSCAACHAHFDPIGLVLENYDLIGRWRTKENDEPIEPRETTVTGETLAGIDDLRKLFAARPEKLYRGITEKLLTYAIGRGLEPSDAVTVDRIAANLAASNGRFSTLLSGIVQSPAFQMRRGDDGATKALPHLAKPSKPATPPPDQRFDRRRRNKAESNSAQPANPPPANATPPRTP
ncbi:MAG: DUF1592 domain-containing protein [Verrucomicrobiota bacterium]